MVLLIKFGTVDGFYHKLGRQLFKYTLNKDIIIAVFV